MNAYLTKQHSCSRGSDGMDASRSAPTALRDAHCACGWQRGPRGLGYNAQTMPSSGPGVPASNRTKLVTLWDSVRRSPHRTSTKGKGTCGEHCACPHGWFSPAQVSLFLMTFSWASGETASKLCKVRVVWKLCWVSPPCWLGMSIWKMVGQEKPLIFTGFGGSHLRVACASPEMLCSVSFSDFSPSSTLLAFRWFHYFAS